MAWTATAVRECLDRNDIDVCSAVVTIYRNQTKAEQASGHTGEYNGVGFNKFDAEILTSFAEQIIRNKKYGRVKLLSPKQIALARKRMKKYAKQLAKIANGEL